MRTPQEKKIIFTLVSHLAKNRKTCWFASVVFSPGATAETCFPIIVKNGEDELVSEGVLEFAGQMLNITEGAASIRYCDFIKGKHETALWLHRDGMMPIPGGLTFR